MAPHLEHLLFPCQVFFSAILVLCICEEQKLVASQADKPIVSADFVVGAVSSQVEAQVDSHKKALEKCGCSRHACSNAHDPLRKCTQRLGNKCLCGGCSDGFQVNFDASYVRTPPGVNPANLSSLVADSICLHQGLDETFLRLKNKNVKAWTYFGSAAGVMRIWPSQSRLRGMTEGSFDPLLGNCQTYEPRLRPWYISAVSSGPKDIVLLIDTSASMGCLSGSTDRISLAAELVENLLNFDALSDLINVIPFGDYAEEFMVDYLVPATKSTKMIINEKVKELVTEGTSNTEDAFLRAFEVLKKSLTYGKTTGCQKVIFLFSDGHSCNSMENGVCADELHDLSGVERTVENGQLSLEKIGASRASIFTFSIGRDANNGIMRRLACQHKGLWAEYTDMDDPLHKLNGFLSFMASLKQSDDIIWSNFYEDDGGLGTMTTATKPIFSFNESQPFRGRLVGVVGHDVLVSQLPSSGSSYQKVLGKVIDRVSTCGSQNPGLCAMQILRGKADQCSDTLPADKCHILGSNVFCSIEPAMNQKDASAECKRLGGHLAELKSEEDLLLASAIAGTSGSWIGLNRVQKRDWKWMSNNASATTQYLWAPGFQNPKGDCASVDKRGGMQNVIQRSCSTELSSICQFRASKTTKQVRESDGILEFKTGELHTTPSFMNCANSFEDIDAMLEKSTLGSGSETPRNADFQSVCGLGNVRPIEELACCNCTSSQKGFQAHNIQSVLLYTACFLFLLFMF